MAKAKAVLSSAARRHSTSLGSRGFVILSLTSQVAMDEQQGHFSKHMVSSTVTRGAKRMDILQALKDERERLTQAINALSSTETHGRRKAGNGRRGGRRRLSAAAKKRISEAAKARWAKAKRAGKNSL